MTSRRLFIGVLAALALSGTLAGQTAVPQSGLDSAADAPSGSLAIAGNGSSARHCVSGRAANVHGLGWVPAGTGYTITFESDITLATAIGRMDLSGNDAYTVIGDPDFNFTASTAGTMALYVEGRGRAGCYRYKVEVDRPAQGVAAPAAPRSVRALALPKPPKNPIRTMAITGLASSAKHCITGEFAAKVHNIGRVEAGAQVRIAFDSDIDPIAGLMLMDAAGEQGRFLVDDDSGGDLDPLLALTAPMGGTIGLYVASYTGAAGCYHYQVQIEGGTEPVTASQFNGSWSGTFSGQSSGTLAFSVTNGTITVTQPAQGDGTFSLGALAGDGSFTTSGPEGTCTWSGPFLPGGARQSSASGAWSCSNGAWSGRSGAWSAARTAPPPTCTFTLSRTAVSAPVTASSASITVTTQAGCTWTASSGSSFVAITGGSFGSGSGTVAVSVGANTGAARTGTLTIAGQVVTVSQSGGSCTFTLSRTAVSAPIAASTANVTVTTQTGCGWTASASAFLNIVGASSGSGSGTVNFGIAANAGVARVATLTIAGQTVTVTQSGAAPTPTGRFDGTYDFSFVHPQPGGQRTQVLPAGFLRIRNGVITSSDGTANGAVLDDFGNVRFTAPCWDGGGGLAVWTGIMSVAAGRTGLGNYVCQNGILGGTWRAYNGR